MNYEHRYEEALERAKEQLDGAKAFDYDNEQVAHDIRNTVYNIFPELKESEGERIRKEILSFCKNRAYYFPHDPKYVNINNWIAWLEKQTDKDISLLELKAKAYDDARERMSYAYNQNRVPIGFISEIFPNLNSYENQDDKPQGKSAFEAINEEKVEPKFKVGDWIVTPENKVLQITDIEGASYVFNNESHYWEIYYCDKQCSLWTIEDAKDGDVLVSVSNQPFIYNGKFTEYTVGAYCGLNVYGVFVVEKYLKESNWTNNDNIRPATKEQCNILMKEIHRANFKWDADKKELKNCKL